MTHKTWTFTPYRDGKPAGSVHGLDSRQALAAIRAASAGDVVFNAPSSEPAVEKRAAADLARAA
ncbi:MAG TPA: hypothetical protein VHR18_02060 [Solirubrobacterales bacterium]|nr:hypothetical protein [Solirubrobacterales bacterium]